MKKLFMLFAMVIFISGCASIMKYIKPRPVSLIATEKGMLFRYYAPNATTVTIAGDWNDWCGAAKGRYEPSIDALKDEDKDGIWEIYLKLSPGKHSYKFVIDSNTWVTDPGNIYYDEFGNSEIIIKEEDAKKWGY